MVGTQKKLSGFGSISSIGSLSVCGKFAASVFPTLYVSEDKRLSGVDSDDTDEIVVCRRQI